MSARCSRVCDDDALATNAYGNLCRPHFGNILVELRPRAVLWWTRAQTSTRGFDL